MTIHTRLAEPASGRRPVLRLIVPIPPRASPRACLEAQIDLLLETLDRLTGDPDIEPNGDERDCDLADAETDLEGSDCDREGDGDCDEEDGGDGEPSLAGFQGDGSDRELDLADNEYSLGSLNAYATADRPVPHWAGGAGGDLEADYDADHEMVP